LYYHQVGRTMHFLERIAMKKVYRHPQHPKYNFFTEGVWYVGETGTGKSYEAFKGYDPETCYTWSDDNGWWEGYEGQETVIINDFRGQIPYDKMLNLVDEWPCDVKKRFVGKIPFLSRKVIVTSPLTPEECYHNRNDKDDIAQLLRRFSVRRLYGDKSVSKKSGNGNGNEVVRGNNETLTFFPEDDSSEDEECPNTLARLDDYRMDGSLRRPCGAANAQASPDTKKHYKRRKYFGC